MFNKITEELEITGKLEKTKSIREKLERFFSKPIKFKYTSKHCFWDRANINRNIFIKLEDVLPVIEISKEVQLNILKAIHEGGKSIISGKLTKKIELNHNKINFRYNGFNNQDQSNFLIMTNYNDQGINVINAYIETFKMYYQNVKNFKDNILNDNFLSENNLLANSILSEQDRENYLGIIKPFFIFKKKENPTKINGKILMFYPNFNFELKQINKLSLVADEFTLILVKKAKATDKYSNLLRYGFITMTQQKRFILFPINESKDQLFGIWMNFPDEIYSSKNEQQVESLVNKYKTIIFEKCSYFIMKKKKEEIWSANPSKCTFLLIILFGGRPINFEVKIMEKDSNNYKIEYSVQQYKFYMDNFESSITIPLDQKTNIKNESIANYLKKKVDNPIKQISSFINSNSNSNFNKNAFKDPLNEIFELKNNLQTKSQDLLSNNTLNNNSNTNNKKINLKQLLMNETEQSIQITESNVFQQNKEIINSYQNNITPTKNSIDLNENRKKNPSSIINYMDKVPKNIPSHSPYKNQSNASSAIPPRAPKQQQSCDSMYTQNNPEKISKLPKGEEYEQSLIFASSKGTSRVHSITASKQNEFDETEIMKNNNSNNRDTNKIINQLRIDHSRSTNNINQNNTPREYKREKEPVQNNQRNSEEKRPQSHHKKYLSMNEFMMLNNENNISPISTNKYISIPTKQSEDSIKNQNQLKTLDNYTSNNTEQIIDSARGNDFKIDKNTYEIIFDQAKNIQMLESKVNILQNEIKNLLAIITSNNNEKNMNSKSSTCSCGKKSGDKKLISTGTNTSLDNINFTAEKSASNKNNSSSHQILNINQNNSLLNSLNNHKNKQEESDDHKYDAFLNDNSINFPKQFLDLENKDSESNFDDNSITMKNNQLNKNNHKIKNNICPLDTNLNSNNQIPPKTQSPIHNNIHLPNFPNNNKNTSPIKVTSEGSNINNSKNISLINETKNYVITNKIPTPVNHNNINLSQKDSFSNRKIDYLKKYDETFGKNKMLTLLNNNNNVTNNNDISNSYDVSTNRYFLKAPSGVYKINNNNSIVNENLHFDKKKNDSTFPKIIFNESVEDSGDYEDL